MCARFHRHKKNLRATLRSGSELISLSDRILLLVACRPRARVIRACAVGIARRGAQIGRLGAPCKAGGRRCSLTQECRCRRTPQFRAIGGPVCRAALRLETGRATCRSRTAQDPSAPEIFLNARGSCERAGPVGWGKPVTIQRNSLSRPPGRRGASPRRGRVAGLEGLGGKARHVSALVARGAQAGIRDATLGLEPPPRAIVIGGSSIVEFVGRRPAAAGKW